MSDVEQDHTARFKRKPMSVYEAQDVLMERVACESIEMIALSDAYRRRAAQTLHATMPIPSFHRANMDGYAVRAEDLVGASPDKPIELRVVSQIACGETYAQTLLPGEAARIMTGAQMPEGADAVVKLEVTSGMGLKREELLQQTKVLVLDAVSIGENVTLLGSEIEKGQVIVERGQQLEAGEMALLAMFGISNIYVFTRPKVAIIPTGLEIIPVDSEMEPGKIWNSNAYMLFAQIQEAGGVPKLLPQVGDDMDKLAKAVEAAVDSDYDAVITIGGVSVGDHDILYDYTQRWKGELLFNKLSMRPGSPTTVGILRGKPLFALSGNPSACYVGCEMFVRPALLRMQGAKEPYRNLLRARLAEPYRVADQYVRFVRGIMHTDEQGCLWVRPTKVDRSNATISIRDANCLFVVTPSPNGLDQGTAVDVILLQIP